MRFLLRFQYPICLQVFCVVSTQTSLSDSSSFSYDDLAEPDRLWLRQAADEIRVRLRRTVNEIIESGQVLARARRRLPRGQWEPWLEREAQIPRRSASRLIAVHRVFGKIKPTTLDHFTTTALYTLSQPGVPQSIREYAVEQAKDGNEVTAAAVMEWVALLRDQTPASTRLASKDDAVVDVDADNVHAAENWLTLVLLLDDNATIHLSQMIDPENNDIIISGTLLKTGCRKVATGTTLETVILKLTGEIRQKRCRGKCCLLKSLDQYSRRRDSPDGRNHYCLECERIRVKTYEREKTARIKAASESGAS